MAPRFVLSEYVDYAMALAQFEILEDGTFGGRIPECKGVIAFGDTLRQCENELQSVLEDWVLMGLRMGHTLPVIADINLNEEPDREPVDSV